MATRRRSRAKPNPLTQPVKVGRTRTGSFGSGSSQVAGRLASGSRIGSTDQAVKGGSSAYGRSAPSTGIGGYGAGGNLDSIVATITNPGGTPQPAPTTSPVNPIADRTVTAPAPSVTSIAKTTSAPKTSTATPKTSTASAALTPTSGPFGTAAEPIAPIVAGAKKAAPGRGALLPAPTTTATTTPTVTVVGAKKVTTGRAAAEASTTVKPAPQKKKAGSTAKPKAKAAARPKITKKKVRTVVPKKKATKTGAKKKAGNARKTAARPAKKKVVAVRHQARV